MLLQASIHSRWHTSIEETLPPLEGLLQNMILLNGFVTCKCVLHFRIYSLTLVFVSPVIELWVLYRPLFFHFALYLEPSPAVAYQTFWL